MATLGMTQPRPSQMTSGVNFDSFTPVQRQYFETIKSAPKKSDLVNKYRSEFGIGDQEKLVAGLSKSILDLEGKIKAVEPNVNERTKDFLVNDAQRVRRVNVEEQPLREQYLESMRRKEGAQSYLSSLYNAMNSAVEAEMSDYGNTISAWDTLVGFDQSNRDAIAKAKSSGGLDIGGIVSGILNGSNNENDMMAEYDKKWQDLLKEGSSGGSVNAGSQNSVYTVTRPVSANNYKPSKASQYNQTVNNISNLYGPLANLFKKKNSIKIPVVGF